MTALLEKAISKLKSICAKSRPIGYFCQMGHFLLLWVSQLSWSNSPVLVQDLRSDWMVYSGNSYTLVHTAELDDLQTIYFKINPITAGGRRLQIQSPEKWQLFVNGELIFSGTGSRIFSLDSLTGVRQDVFLGVHATKGVKDISTRLISFSPVLSDRAIEIVPRPPTYFRDYGILVSVFLILFFLLLFRTNPQLTIDYFSFTKIFSVSERNENQLASRITSSVNLLFYLFCALLTGFLLSAILYSAGPFFQAARPLQITSLGSAFWIWTKLSLFILILLMAKLIIVLLFSTLFNFRETMSFQFFNFLRFVLFTSVTLAILCLAYFILRVGEPIYYERLIVLALLLLTAGSVVVLVKLTGRAGFSFFHLFSYLCVSEIIPLVIIIKIFF